MGSCVCCLVLVAFGALGALALAACGGAASSPNSPAETAHESATRPADDATGSDEATPEDEPAKPALCEDGTCSPCGTGVCPSGWYCDESASGGPACGWLPQCAQKSSCACLAGKLGSGCKCSEQGGGLHVSCK